MKNLVRSIKKHLDMLDDTPDEFIPCETPKGSPIDRLERSLGDPGSRPRNLIRGFTYFWNGLSVNVRGKVVTTGGSVISWTSSNRKAPAVYCLECRRVNEHSTLCKTGLVDRFNFKARSE